MHHRSQELRPYENEFLEAVPGGVVVKVPNLTVAFPVGAASAQPTVVNQESQCPDLHVGT